MVDITLTTEVAGRVCAICTDVGSMASSGDDVIMVEAMKMEIPVSCSAAGKIKSILVTVDDVVAEGQAVAVLDT